MTEAEREATLRRLMAAYGDGVARVCYLYLKDAQLAQDAAQETFVKAWGALHTLRSGATEKAWLMRIAVNTCKNVLRSRAYRAENGRVSLEDVPEPAMIDALPDDTVLREVTALPEKYREVVILHYYQGLDVAATARALRLLPATVRSRLFRARNMLKPRLERWYFDE